MSEIIYCSACKSTGTTNRCYITGYNSKCSHDYGLAHGFNKNGKYPDEVITCNSCSGQKNMCYITGYDYKCGHDNGWAYEPGYATCNSCGKKLSGKWKMESNPANNSYFNTSTGRYLGISDGYFLYGNNPNWVYSYCHSCWVKEIQKILPSLGLENKENQKTISDLKNNINELKNKIQTKENEIIKLQNENKKLENELIKLKEQGNNLVSTPINTINIENNFEFILSQSFLDLKIEKIKNLLKSSNINEISNLCNLITSNIIYNKMKEDIKNLCQSKIKKL
jgi:hypothetical protein